MPRQTPNPQPAPRPRKTKEERVSEKVEAKLVEQETAARVEAMIAQQRAEQAAAERTSRVGRRPFEQMIQAAGAELQTKQESQTTRVDALLQAAGVEVESPEAAAEEARQHTLGVAQLAASMIRDHNSQTDQKVKPNTTLATRVGSASVQKVTTKVPSWRLATRRTRQQRRDGVEFEAVPDGMYTGRPVERTKILGTETETFHHAVAYGWEIPIARKNLPGSSKLILTPDGEIVSVHAQKRRLADLSFSEGHGLSAEATDTQALVAKNYQNISYLDESLESDIAGYNLNIKDPVSRAEIAMGRENDIQQGLAVLVAQLGVVPQQG